MSVERIQQHFRDSAAVKLEALETLSMPIAAAIDTLFAALANVAAFLRAATAARRPARNNSPPN